MQPVTDVLRDVDRAEQERESAQARREELLAVQDIVEEVYGPED